ncbi:unnamed protein product [Parascedosporium putredinis]|uniref:Zinc/iron permease n=1 Tax=Parascedosporium putredinis TaxID=1442378 RepID=A0A9P1H9R7_9PEZI|nr:unnamed protein product [Parascedosporium putredinis]CAI8001977.1 unnamed protein product [Parascedosporium putredinis]
MDSTASMVYPRDSWSSLTTEDLLSELSKRQHSGAAMDGPKPECGSTMNMGSYNTPLHVGALFLILCLGTISTFPGLFMRPPLISNPANKSALQRTFLFYCQHLGTGVLLATSFIHLLPMAFMSLMNPCLPDFFSKKYPPGHVHNHPGMWDSDDEDERTPRHIITPPELSLAARRHQYPAAMSLHDLEASEGLVDGVSPRPGQTPLPEGTPTGVGERKSMDSDSDMELDVHELDPHPHDDETHKPLNGHSSTGRPPADADPHCLLLEAGILFHSIFIGIALSVESGPTFLAIGLVIHNMYDPQSEAGLLTVGIMNAISAGLLLFAGLVQLLAEDFLTEKSYQTLKGTRRRRAFMSVVGGALLMAAVRLIA